MQKTREYYIKDGIECSKRALIQALKDLKWALGDLAIGYFKLIKIKIRRKK